MQTIIDRFDKYWIPEPNSGCYLWLACVDGKGYGRFGANGRNVKAHRFSLQTATGQSGAGLFACHKCDNTYCVNPEHLFWGSAADNNRDVYRKGRRKVAVPVAEAHWKCRLPTAVVYEIRASSLPRVIVAARHGITPRYVSDIRALRSRKFG